MTRRRMPLALSAAVLALILAGCGGGGAPQTNTPIRDITPALPPPSTITAPAPTPVTDAMPFIFDATPLVTTVGAAEPLTLAMTLRNGTQKPVSVDKRFPQLEYRIYDTQGKQMSGPPMVQVFVRPVLCVDLATLKPDESISTENAAPIWKWKLKPGAYGVEVTLTIHGGGADCNLHPWKGAIVSRRAAFTIK